MRFYFIRHGQSENNALWEETGSSSGRSDDPELTQIGHEQAGLLAKFIAQKDQEARADSKNGEPTRDSFGFTHLYTSLMVRSVATATYVSRALQLPLIAWPEIHECGGIYLDGEAEGERFGRPGKTRSYFAKNYQDLCLPETVEETGWWNRPFETDEDRPLRAQQVLNMLLEKHGRTEDRVAIVSHGGFYMELMRVMFKIGLETCWYLMNNTAVSRFDFRDDGEITLAYHNRTDHLPERLIT
jgi:2,3-bisphosphoglycerate-dependent phosphoglycerate mutase